MTRKSRREIESAIEHLDDTDDEDRDEFEDVVVSYKQPDDWEPDPDAVVIDFTEVDT